MIYLTTRFFVKTVSISETVFPARPQKIFSIVRDTGGVSLGESSFGNEGVIFVHPFRIVSKASRNEPHHSLNRCHIQDFLVS